MLYKDSQGNVKLKLFFQEGIVTQVRVYLEDDNPEVSEKVLIISNTHFKSFKHISLKKKYRENGAEITEYYIDNILQSRFITKKSLLKKEVLGIGLNEKIFYKEIECYDKSGDIVNRHATVYNADGTLTMG